MLATVDDQILVSDRSTLKPAFEDFARAGSIPSLRGQRRAGDVRGHAVVRHAPPSMIVRRWLREPDIPGIAGEMAALEGADNRIAVADLGARCVHDVGATLHLRDELVVEEILGLWMQRRIDRDHVADLDHVFDRGVPGETELHLQSAGQALPIEIMELDLVERKPFAYGIAA